MRPGRRNLITDVPGILVGNASDATGKTGVTVVKGDAPMTGAVHVTGGRPGTRMTDVLSLAGMDIPVDAFVLSGGSAFGLDAAGGVMEALAEDGVGYPVRNTRIPTVPSAIVLDFGLGEGERPAGLYRRLGIEAYRAAGDTFTLGTAGAGTGVATSTLKGGLGSASATLASGVTVGAVVVVNSAGQVTERNGPRFLAAPFEEGSEFGGLGAPSAAGEPQLSQPEAGAATTIAVVATDLALTRTQAHRLAMMAQDVMARAIMPSHTSFDGDLVFAASTGRRESAQTDLDMIGVGHAAATCLARAIARAVYEARPAPGDPKPTWRDRFG